MLQWIRERLRDRYNRSAGDREPFPSDRCPCGAPQPDGDRLYCDACIEGMIEDVAPEHMEGSP